MTKKFCQVYFLTNWESVGFIAFQAILPVFVTGVDDLLFKRFKLPSVFNFEVADAGAAEGLEAGAVVEGLAEVVRQTADVGAYGHHGP